MMKPPRQFRVYKKRGYGLCAACGNWKKTNMFYAEGMTWRLCLTDWVDYWENTSKLPEDFKDYDFKEWR